LRDSVFHNNTSIKHVSVDDINQACLRALRYPDALAVKDLLKENKDELLVQYIKWIFQNPKYVNWKDRDDVCLFWIKAGAGKGKTIIAICLIEQLSLQHAASALVTYFFCQNADTELNTLESIIKGLIFQLIEQQKPLGESLRRH